MRTRGEETMELVENFVSVCKQCSESLLIDTKTVHRGGVTILEELPLEEEETKKDEEFDHSTTPKKLVPMACFHCGRADLGAPMPSRVSQTCSRTTTVQNHSEQTVRLMNDFHWSVFYDETGLFRHVCTFLCPVGVANLSMCCKTNRNLLWGYELDLLQMDSKHWFNMNELAGFFVTRSIRRMWKVKGLALQTVSEKCLNNLFHVFGKNEVQRLKVSTEWAFEGLHSDVLLGGLASSLMELDLSYCRELLDLNPISRCNSLETLQLAGCEKLRDITALEHCPKLTRIGFEGCRNLQSIESLRACKQLTEVDLSLCYSLFLTSAQVGGHTIAPVFPELPVLRKLSLRGCTQLRMIPRFTNSISSLKELDLSLCDQLIDISALASCSGLRTLYLGSCDSLEYIGTLSECNNLESLDLSHCYRLKSVAVLSKCTNLRNLNIGSCVEIETIELQGCKHLERLCLTGCSSLHDISQLAHCQALEHLDMPFCTNMTSIVGLARCTNLKTLNLTRCTKLSDISPIQHLPNLRQLDIKWCPNITLEALSKIKHLKPDY